MNAAAELLRLIHGYRITQAIHVAARLRLADHLADGPRAPAELAAAVGCDPHALHRLLRALATVEVFAELPDGRFASTPMGDELRSDAEGRLADWAAFVGSSSTWTAWGRLEHSVRTGENAYGVIYGENVWEYRGARPEESAVFDAAMSSLSRRVSAAILEAYDFDGFSTVCDVGGGTGSLLAAILQRYPAARGILFEQPHVAAGAPEILAAAGVADRCSVVGGDIFEAVPPDADVYLMKSILHDWPDDRATAVARTCRAAMKPGAVLLVLERVVTGPPYNPASASIAMSDLNMLVGPGGRERTAEEYGALLAEGGLTLSRVIPTEAEFSIVEARAS